MENRHSIRNNTIDVSRLFFAFCVVCIHVPLMYKEYVMPILRCAVPFFYMVSGYFLSTGDIERKLKINFKKWFILWFKYYLIIGFISIVLHSVCGEKIVCSWYDIIETMVFDGKTLSMDHIVINGESTGLYTIWFLLSGAYAFGFFYLCRRLSLSLRIVFVFSGIALCFGVILSALGFKVPRWLYLSIPYISLGMMVRRLEQKLDKHKILVVILLACLLCGVSTEFYIFRGMTLETTLLSPALMFFVFLVLLQVKLYGKTFSYLASLGRNTTLLIYIYHRPVYAIALLITPPQYYALLNKFGAFIIFLITLVFAMIYKKLIITK